MEDRKELFREITLNDVVNWETYYRVGTQDSPIPVTHLGDPGPTGPTSSIADPCVECDLVITF